MVRAVKVVLGKRLKDNAKYDDFQAVLERDCHCGQRHVISSSAGECWELFLRVKACLQLVRDVNVSNRDVIKFGLEAGLGQLKVEAEEKLKVL